MFSNPVNLYTGGPHAFFLIFHVADRCIDKLTSLLFFQKYQLPLQQKNHTIVITTWQYYSGHFEEWSEEYLPNLLIPSNQNRSAQNPKIKGLGLKKDLWYFKKMWLMLTTYFLQYWWDLVFKVLSCSDIKAAVIRVLLGKTTLVGDSICLNCWAKVVVWIRLGRMTLK